LSPCPCLTGILGGQEKAVPACLALNYGEFARIKTRVPVFDRTLCSRTDANHIAHFRKKVSDGVAAFDRGVWTGQ
jgi:hypothetical protein